MTKQRDLRIDILKGFAVVLMSFVHVNSLFFSPSYGILDFVTYVGSTVCFSMFLFSFGFVLGKKNGEDYTGSWKKTLSWISKIYIAYLIIGIFSYLILNGETSWSGIVKIILFQELPLYSEFLVAFILFSLLGHVFNKPLRDILKNTFLLLSVSVFAYALGTYLSRFDVTSDLLIGVKALLVGHENIHTFPLLQYLPVYLFGLYLSKLNGMKSFFIVLLMFSGIFFFTKLFNLDIWYRWPPSFYFILLGLIFNSFVLLMLTSMERYLEKMKVLITFGQNSLYALVILTIQSLLLTLILSSSSNAYWILLLNLLVLTTSYLFIKVLKVSQK